MHRRFVMPLALLCALPLTARAEDEPLGVETSTGAMLVEPIELGLDVDYEVTVRARRPLTAASSMTVRARDFALRPARRPADVLSVAPGLYVVQHAGGGKANQYFLRGFDADHGTDVALSLDGVPVNLVSHGHGQGYADFNWLIPEIVERIEVSKGPYFAELGDFATAGAINLVTRRDLHHSSISLSGGSFRTLRSTLLTSPQLEGWQPLVAADFHHSAGPFERAEDLNRFSFFSKVTRDLGGGARLSLAATSYGSGWNASGQIPQREVLAGRLGRFGSLDDQEGGSSQRHSAYAMFQSKSEDGELSAMAYLVSYRFQLFSNFTFFSRDPGNGDLIEQGDARTFGGLNARYAFVRTVGSTLFDTAMGVQLRADSIENALYYNRDRTRLESVVDADVGQVSLGAWAREEIVWFPWLRTQLGVRADYYAFDVDDRLDASRSGEAGALLVSPKSSVVITPARDLDLYLNFGRGFHSNDARGVVLGQGAVTPLTAATGWELGFRTELFEALDLAGAAFLLDLDGETVWVGDEGTTELRGPTRRVGVELEARLKLTSWLWADLDVTWSRGRYTEAPSDADAIALAPKLTVSGGLSARHESGAYGRVGAFALGDRDASEDRFFVAEGFTRLDATAGFENDTFAVSLSVQNILDTEWREAQFANVSRLAGETSAASCGGGSRAAVEGGAFQGCEDLHFTPGAPLNVQASLAVFF